MNLNGKNCLITGANTGLGFAVSKLVASKGADTIMLSRNEEKGENAVSEIKKETPNASVDLVISDLASTKSIHDCIEELSGKYSKLDILYNNAAVMKKKRTITEDGFEMMFQVNYLAPFIFMNSFLDLLKNGSSPVIINICRPADKLRLDLNDMQFSKKYSMWSSFFKTKLCLVFASLEYSRRHERDGISVMMVDPGSRPFKSDLARDVPLVGWIKNLFSAPVDEAAEHILYHITSDEAKNKNGKVYKGKQEWTLPDYWKERSISERLWSVTESLIENA
jgi:NAD(P)-dependent dehydrogenase (short-subunit alcohol dehydrogenase family)